jgi:DNA-binding HxlR family transcriptional regulator
MKHSELAREDCAIARSSAVVGERWVWVILRQAFNGARRFEDFQRGIGLARNVLSERLSMLAEHGILERRVLFSDSQRSAGGPLLRPPHEYRLTDKGRALFPAYVALMQWGNEWTGLARPPVRLRHKSCGERFSARVVCSSCGEDLDARHTEPVLEQGLSPRDASPPRSRR